MGLGKWFVNLLHQEASNENVKGLLRWHSLMDHLDLKWQKMKLLRILQYRSSFINYVNNKTSTLTLRRRILMSDNLKDY